MSKTTPHVAVLMGGWSSEREVSLKSGEACAQALEAEGFEVTRIDADRNLAAVLSKLKPDVCFNALHGKWGEDGCVQGLLEILGIPYTHSGVLASALAMNKARAKVVLQSAGVPVAESLVAPRREVMAKHLMSPPYVVKPVADGSSVGVHIVDETAAAPPRDLIAADGPEDEPLLVERYIKGREFTCTVMGDKPLAVTEILPAEGLAFYDYQAKYAPGGSKHILPAPLSPNLYEKIRQLSLTAHQVLGCRGISRTDFRLDEAQPHGSGLFCLEVNTQPGMTATSLAPEQAAHEGLSFAALVRWIVEDASVGR